MEVSQIVTYADILRPSENKYALLYDLALVIGGTLFIALSAQIAIPLPFSPVPVTGQTLAVLLTGALLGSRRAAKRVEYARQLLDEAHVDTQRIGHSLGSGLTGADLIERAAARGKKAASGSANSSWGQGD